MRAVERPLANLRQRTPAVARRGRRKARAQPLQAVQRHRVDSEVCLSVLMRASDG